MESNPRVPEPDRPDPLTRMTVHQLAVKLREDSWSDLETISTNPVTVEVAGQMYKSIGSIAANIAEGYSKSSGPDRARSFEYALGSARETVEWYGSTRAVLGDPIVNARLNILGDIRRLLVAIIPRERVRTIRPKKRPRPRPS